MSPPAPRDSGTPGPRDFEGVYRVLRGVGAFGTSAYGIGLVVVGWIIGPQIPNAIRALGDVSAALTRASVAMEESAKSSARVEASCGRAEAACAPCAGLASEVAALRAERPRR